MRKCQSVMPLGLFLDDRTLFCTDDYVAVHLGAIYSAGGQGLSSGIYVGMCETVSYCRSQGRLLEIVELTRRRLVRSTISLSCQVMLLLSSLSNALISKETGRTLNFALRNWLNMFKSTFTDRTRWSHGARLQA